MTQPNIIFFMVDQLAAKWLLSGWKQQWTASVIC